MTSLSDMKAMARWTVILLLAVSLLAGCSDEGSLDGALDTSADARSRPEAAAVTTPRAEGKPESTVGVASADTAEDDAAGSGGGSFGDGPRAEGGSGLDADTLLAVRHGEHRGYERIVLDLGAGEEPAVTVPRWKLVSPKGGGLLRVELPSANSTVVSNGTFGAGLLKSFHVVRAPEDGMIVDVLAREPFRYRVLQLESPSRLVVDFEPVGKSLRRPPPAVGGQTVLLEPRAGARVSDPLTISGYSRNFEAANTILLTDAGGEVLLRQTVTANDWSSTWGYFEATLDLPPFSGRGMLRVGAASARDGSFEGVKIPVKGS